MNVDFRLVPALGAALVCLLLAPIAAAQSFAGLGEASEDYAQVVPGTEITFPADHGAHPDYRIEWWYLVTNLTGEDGARYGAQFTLFRNATAPNDDAVGWDSAQVWLGHAALTTADAHYHAEKFARGGVGQAGARAEPFEAWVDDWSLASAGADFSPLRLRARADGFAYDLTLRTDAMMVKQGDRGYSVKSDAGQASYYVSQPFFEVGGTVEIDGRAIAVTGRGWMDREWSSQPLAEDQTGWDWFSLHLGSGEKVMLFRLRDTGGGTYFSGNWITPDGESTPIPREAIRLDPQKTARVAGRDIPVEWRIRVEGRGLDVSAAPLNPQAWNDGFTSYWEGPIFIVGSHTGEGYLEMTGYQRN